MKYKINKKRVISGIALAILTVLLSGLLFLNILIPSFAANKAAEYNDVGLYFNADEALRDPTKVETPSGYYYSPESYVYFGSVYNSSSGLYEPILCRVLDADADNNGDSGAMLVFTENAVYSDLEFATGGEFWAEYLDTENIYTESSIYKYAYQENLFSSIEKNLIREITKTDVAAEMEGMFGYAKDYGYTWETDTVNGNEAVKSESAVMLNSSKVFPLSAKELHDYVADYNGAPGLSAVHAITKSPVSWWLRTGFDDEYGNLVGVVNESGKVVGNDATSTDVAGRFAFNIKTDNISYVQAVDNNVYRLAYRSDLQNEFSAKIVDVKDETVKIEFSGSPTDIVSNNRRDIYISVIIKDSDGNVKHYESIDEAVKNASGSRSFKLPDNYSEDDSIYVFWEEKGDNYWDISFTGEMIELGCVHTPLKNANCQHPAICARCDEEYGTKAWDVHENISTEFYFDSEEDVHWNICVDCGEKLNLTSCVFGDTCVSSCVCGNNNVTRINHNFDENGICIYDKNHYEPPVQIGRGAVSDFEIHNEGQFLFLAEYVNSGLTRNIYGEFWGHVNIVELAADLDFSNIDFIPMGTEEHPFDALYFEGKGHTVKGITYDAESNYVGVFGVASDVIIDDMKIADCNFSGKLGAGLLVGKATDVDVKGVFAINSTVEATDESGCEGSLIGVAEGNTSIGSASMSYDVYNSSNALIAFSGNGAAVVSNSFCLAENSNSEKGEMTREQFANGEVGYAYAADWSGRGKKAGQKIGVDPYPVMNGEPIFLAVTCDGRTVYFNGENNRTEIESHSFKEFARDPVEFIWREDGGFSYNCYVHAICEICGKEGLAEAEVYEKVYSSSAAQTVPRIDYTATITLGDVTATDSRMFISNNIQEFFGVTKVEKTFDGQYVSPFEILENTRLDPDEYNAFFINSETGEKYYEIGYDWYGQPYEVPISVLGVGTYDLHLIGQEAFEGQEYIYKEILVIDTVTVTVTPKDVYKFYDGSTVFTPEFIIDADKVLGDHWISVKYGNSSSANVGTYSLNVSVDIDREIHDRAEFERSIKIILVQNTVNAFILPANKVIIENKSYPTSFTYGDSITVPTKEHFNVNFDMPLTFEWYSATYDYYEEKAIDLKKIDGQPKNAGTYVLRVSSAPTDNTLAASYDLVVEIEKKKVSLSVTAPDGVETRDYSGTTYYFIDSIDQISYEVKGLVNGDTIETANIIINPSLNSMYPFDDCPDRKNYHVLYYFFCRDEFNVEGNYEGDNESIYVSLTPNSIPTPLEQKSVYEGGELPYEILISWKAPSVLEGYGEFYEYTVEMYNSNGDKVFTTTKGTPYSVVENTCVVSLTKSDEYTVVIRCIRRNYTNATSGEEFVLDTYSFEVIIENDYGEMLDCIDGMGRYTVTVSCNGKESSAEVLAQRRISMFVKETSINMSDVAVKFDRENIVMKAGEVLLLGHTLSEVEFDINTANGSITVSKIVVVDANGNDVSYLYALNTYDSSQNYNILHVYDSPCDSECNLSHCDKTRVAAHSGGKATCTELAVCSSCGMLYGEYDRKAHTSNATSIVVNPEDHMTHLELANCCGAVIRVTEHVQKTEATCTELATCLYCGWRYGELDPTNHSSNELKYSQISGNKHDHLKTHVCCGATENEAHTGGSATCVTLAKCDKCQGSYGELNKDAHENNPICSVDTTDANKHKISYSCCNASWIESHSGGKATCTDQAICDFCKEKYGEIDAQNHATDTLEYLVREDNVSMHDVYYSCCHLYVGKAYHSGGTPTCTTPALCENCGEPYGKTDPSRHQSNEYTYISDGEMHIKAYACCLEEISKEEHKHTEFTCMNGDRCELCGYEQGERAEHVYDNSCDYICNVCNEVTRAASFHIDENNDRLCDNCEAELEAEGLSGGAISGIVVGSVTAAGIGGFSLFWFVIKKKSLAALLKLLLG